MHMPGNIRADFVDLVEEYRLAHLPDTRLARDKRLALLLDSLAECSDVMPGDICDALVVPRGSSYADAVRELSKLARAK